MYIYYILYILYIYTHTYTYTYVLTSSLSLAKFWATGNGPISLRTALFGGEPDRLHVAWVPAGICAQEMLVVFGIMGYHGYLAWNFY